jgi:hypothetical protein
MTAYSEGDLRIESTPTEHGLQLTWLGRSNARHPGKTLVPFFDRIAGQVKGTGGGIEMRFDSLEEINSSTLTAVIQLIQRLKGSQSKLTLIYDPDVTWQRMSFEALQVFARQGLVKIQPAIKGPDAGARPG